MILKQDFIFYASMYYIDIFLAVIVIMQHHFKHAGLVHFKCWLSSYCTDTLVGSGAIINK